MTVGKAIDRVIEQISNLKSEMHKEIHGLTNKMHVEIHGLRKDMDNQFRDMGKQFTDLKERVTAVESTLTYVRNAQTQISSKFIDYTFKAGWLLLAGSVSYVVVHFFGLIA